MHQDWDKRASAVTTEEFDKDYAIVKELGANFLRLAHYPHNDYAFKNAMNWELLFKQKFLG